jgi:hypothetical protein
VEQILYFQPSHQPQAVEVVERQLTQTDLVRRVVQAAAVLELLAFLELGEVVLLTKDLLAVIHPQVAQAQAVAVVAVLEQ